MNTPSLVSIIDLYAKAGVLNGDSVSQESFKILKNDFKFVKIVLEKLQFLDSLIKAYSDFGLEAVTFTGKMEQFHGTYNFRISAKDLVYKTDENRSESQILSEALIIMSRINFSILPDDVMPTLISLGPTSIRNLEKLRSDIFSPSEKYILQALQIRIEHLNLGQTTPNADSIDSTARDNKTKQKI